MDGDPAFEKQKADSIDQIKSVHVPRVYGFSPRSPISDARRRESTDSVSDTCWVLRALSVLKWAQSRMAGLPYLIIANIFMMCRHAASEGNLPMLQFLLTCPGE